MSGEPNQPVQPAAPANSRAIADATLADWLADFATPDQVTAWTMAAGDRALADWLVEVADSAAVAARSERTWPVVIDLEYPVDHGSERITQVTMRRGTVRDVKGLRLAGGDLPADQLVTIASRLSGLTTIVIEKLDGEDAGEVMSVALDFYVKFLGAGRKRSR